MSNETNVKEVAGDRTPYVELKGITHSYGPVLALNGVDFKVYRRRNRRPGRGQWRRKIDPDQDLVGCAPAHQR